MVHVHVEIYWIQVILVIQTVLIIHCHHFVSFANAFSTGQHQSMQLRRTIDSISIIRQQRKSSSSRLYGIAEWRAKFTSSSDATTPTTPSQTGTGTGTGTPSSNTTSATLPLLLLPFKPTQILLPGQTTTLKFKHGKYIDMIDEAITSYECVLGMSILDQDGLLPHVVICEVIEEDMEVNMGYRGFSSMSISVRAVGRAKRVFPTIDDETKLSSSLNLNKENDDFATFHGRTALDDIHLGQFVEWTDTNISSEEDFDTAEDYLKHIDELLMLTTKPLSSSTTTTTTSDNNSNSEYYNRIQRQKILFEETYDAILENVSNDIDASSSSSSLASSYSNNLKGIQHAQLIAMSWSIFAAATITTESIFEDNNEDSTDSDTAGLSLLITQALATQDTVKRIRLGLAMLLESRMPVVVQQPSSSSDGNTGETESKMDQYYDDNAFQ